MTTMELIERGIGHNCLSDAYDLGRAEAIDEMLSKIHTTWLFRGNDAKAYREEIDYIADKLKEQNNDNTRSY